MCVIDQVDESYLLCTWSSYQIFPSVFSDRKGETPSKRRRGRRLSLKNPTCGRKPSNPTLTPSPLVSGVRVCVCVCVCTSVCVMSIY